MLHPSLPREAQAAADRAASHGLGWAAAPKTVTKRFKGWLILIAGWGFIALGVVGLFLPFLQGVLFLLVGISILSLKYAWARRLLRRLRERFPGLSERLDAASARAHGWLRRIFPARSDGTRN